MWYLKRASPYEQDLLASRKVTSRSSSRSVLLPTIKITMAGLASVLASVSQLARQLNDSLKSLFEPKQMITNMFQKTLIIHQPVSKPGGNVIHQQCPCCPSVITSRHTAKPLLKKVMIFFLSVHVSKQKSAVGLFTWPAVSQIWSLTVLPPTGTILLPNSTPIVCALSSLNCPSMNWGCSCNNIETWNNPHGTIR